MQQTFTVMPDEAGQRLDVFCVSKLPTLSRAAIQKAIKSGGITVNGATVKPKHAIRAGAVVGVKSPESMAATPAPRSPEGEVGSLPILYEDKDVVVINKPAGISVYAGQAHETVTVASWFSDRYPTARQVGSGPERPGIVHRLDKDTSGVLLLAKTPAAFTWLSKQFASRRAKKEYLALVFGVPTMTSGRITRSLGRSKRNPVRRTVDDNGREAVTEWRLIKKFGEDFSLLRIWPLTGRMHQIRVHLHFIGHPIVGDSLYTIRKQRPPHGVKRQLLHATKLTITLPHGGKKSFTAPLPDDFDILVHAQTIRYN